MLGGMTKKYPIPVVNSLILEQAHALIYKLVDRRVGGQPQPAQRQLFQAPSIDGPRRAPSAWQRPAFGKKRCAQPSHHGQRRERHRHGDRLSAEAYCPAPECPCCGGKVLAHDKPYRVHQVFDLPAVSYLVTEHQLFRATYARCIHTVDAALPGSVSECIRHSVDRD